jgi:hypothetical protein
MFAILDAGYDIPRFIITPSAGSIVAGCNKNDMWRGPEEISVRCEEG